MCCTCSTSSFSTLFPIICLHKTIPLPTFSLQTSIDSGTLSFTIYIINRFEIMGVFWRYTEVFILRVVMGEQPIHADNMTTAGSYNLTIELWVTRHAILCYVTHNLLWGLSKSEFYSHLRGLKLITLLQNSFINSSDLNKQLISLKV